MPNEQQAQMAHGAKRAHRNHDYVDLFPVGVFPTGQIDILERGGNLLLIKTYEHGQKIKDAHRKIFNLLTKLGDLDGAPGNITVVCVWGLGLLPREWVIFDWTGNSAPRVGSIEDWRYWLAAWWRDNKRLR